MGLAGCLERGWGIESAANGKNEQSRVDTGADFSDSVSAPASLQTKALITG